MDQKTVDGLNLLAEKLGVASETLIGHFILRAPWEALSTVLLGIVLISLVSVLVFLIWWMWKHENDRDFVGFLAFMLTIAVVGFFVGFLIDAEESIMALVAPEAYAIEQIIQHLR